eukprot:10084855-Prorocentrum_lima.AAC.1
MLLQRLEEKLTFMVCGPTLDVIDVSGDEADKIWAKPTVVMVHPLLLLSLIHISEPTRLDVI